MYLPVSPFPLPVFHTNAAAAQETVPDGDCDPNQVDCIPLSAWDPATYGNTYDSLNPGVAAQMTDYTHFTAYPTSGAIIWVGEGAFIVGRPPQHASSPYHTSAQMRALLQRYIFGLSKHCHISPAIHRCIHCSIPAGQHYVGGQQCPSR